MLVMKAQAGRRRLVVETCQKQPGTHELSSKQQARVLGRCSISSECPSECPTEHACTGEAEDEQLPGVDGAHGWSDEGREHQTL